MSTPTVIFPGNGDAFGSGGRPRTCIHISCGVVALAGMKRLGIDPRSIGLMAFTHLHGNHFGCIVFLLLDGQFCAVPTLVIFGPLGVSGACGQAMEVLFSGSSSVSCSFPMDLVEGCAGKRWSCSGLPVIPHRVFHPSGGPPVALRVAACDKSPACTGDTGKVKSLLAAAQGMDLLIAEALFHAKVVKYHLSVATLCPARGKWAPNGSHSRAWGQRCWPRSANADENAPRPAQCCDGNNHGGC